MRFCIAANPLLLMGRLTAARIADSFQTELHMILTDLNVAIGLFANKFKYYSRRATKRLLSLLNLIGIVQSVPNIFDQLCFVEMIPDSSLWRSRKFGKPFLKAGIDRRDLIQVASHIVWGGCDLGE